MARTARFAPRRFRKLVQVQKPTGSLAARVQLVGPEHFGILSIDVAKARFKMALNDFYGNSIIPPTEFDQTQGDLRRAVDCVRAAQTQAQLHDLVVAIESTGEYHRPVQRAFRNAGFEVRLVHPLATKQFRQVADPGNKTDDTDLAGIHRAAVNGFGLIEQTLPPDYARMQMLIRHRRDLVEKASALRCQIREHLHAAMPGYAACFGDFWISQVALPIARATGSAERLRRAGAAGLADIVKQAGLRCHRNTLDKLVAWADTAPPCHPLTDSLGGIIGDLDDDRTAKNQQILALERQGAPLLARTPYVRLLIIPGINVVSAADLAGEAGPISHYANANAITGRAGLFPSRYQSDLVDHPDGALVRYAHRKLRAALLQIADNLITCNQYFRAKAALWDQAGNDLRWMRIKVAKSFSRIAYTILAGAPRFTHPCLQERHYVLQKLNAFHCDHDTPMPALLDDLKAAIEQLPQTEYANEAKPLQEELNRLAARRRGPRPLSEIIPIVLARLGIDPVESNSEGLDLS
jgi:transposase